MDSRPTYHLGIHHHQLYSDGIVNDEIHERTLGELLAWPEFSVVDMYCAGSTAQQAREAAMVRASGKTAVYNIPLFDKMHGCDPNATDSATITRTRDTVLPHLDAAADAMAMMTSIPSGLNPAPWAHGQLAEGWLDFLSWFGLEVGNRGMDALIEPYDAHIGKNIMVGPTRYAVHSIEAMRAQGIDNVYLMVDMGHLPITGESFAHALGLSAPYLRHIHLGNAIIRDPMHPWYGDCHSPLGLPEGEYNLQELADFLGTLRGVGYFKNHHASLTLEMRPYPMLDQRRSVDCWLQMLNEAWELITLRAWKCEP